MTGPQTEEMAKRGIYWVPTIVVGAYVANGRQGNWPKMVETEKAAFWLALTKGVKIVLGTDAGGFDWRDLNEAKEFEYYVNYEMTPMQASARLPLPPRSCWAGRTKWEPWRRESGRISWRFRAIR